MDGDNEPDFLERDRWRALYKPPIEKRTADLQWRIIHRAIATNRYVAHLNPAVGGECRFCMVEETVEHLFLRCSRLGSLFRLLNAWFRGFGEEFSNEVFIGGLKYKVVDRGKVCLLNYLIGTAKLAMWKTRKNKELELGSIDAEMMLKCMVKGRIKMEFSYYKLINNVESFLEIWGINEVLCVTDDGVLFFNFLLIFIVVERK